MTFRTITTADWSRSIISARSQPNVAWLQIRAKLSSSVAPLVRGGFCCTNAADGGLNFHPVDRQPCAEEKRPAAMQRTLGESPLAPSDRRQGDSFERSAKDSVWSTASRERNEGVGRPLRRDEPLAGQTSGTEREGVRAIMGAEAVPHSISQFGTVRDCVPLELERTDKCTATVQASSTHKIAPDGITLNDGATLAARLPAPNWSLRTENLFA